MIFKKLNEMCVVDEPTHKINIITLLKNENISLRLHKNLFKSWTIAKGFGVVELDKGSVYSRVLSVKPGDLVSIPAHTFHKITNPDEDNLILIEILVREPK